MHKVYHVLEMFLRSLEAREPDAWKFRRSHHYMNAYDIQYRPVERDGTRHTEASFKALYKHVTTYSTLLSMQLLRDEHGIRVDSSRQHVRFTVRLDTLFPLGPLVDTTLEPYDAEWYPLAILREEVVRC